MACLNGRCACPHQRRAHCVLCLSRTLPAFCLVPCDVGGFDSPPLSVDEYVHLHVATLPIERTILSGAHQPPPSVREAANGQMPKSGQSQLGATALRSESPTPDRIGGATGPTPLARSHGAVLRFCTLDGAAPAPRGAPRLPQSPQQKALRKLAMRHSREIRGRIQRQSERDPYC
eukprot:5306188-Prymnesium_polylepis.1